MVVDDAEPESHADIEVLRSTRDESRTVLDHQLDVLAEIDEKAIWSVRTAIIVLGLLISVASLTDGGTSQSTSFLVSSLAVSGTLALLFTVWFGMFTYHWSFEAFGIGPRERTVALSGGIDERAWLNALLRDGYPVWIERQTIFNVYNNRFLAITHLLLSLGVSLVIAAGGLYLIGA